MGFQVTFIRISHSLSCECLIVVNVKEENCYMDLLKEKGIIEEINSGNNFGYVLNDNRYFVNTDYKVLLSQTSDVFVQCMKISYNGKIEIFYLTDEYRPISTLINGIQSDTLITILLNLFAAIIEVKNNGFLSCHNIDMSWDKIFVNTSTFKTKLIYVPVNCTVYGDYAEFENELRSNLIKMINNVVQCTSPRLEQFSQDLANGSLTLTDLYNKSKDVGMSNLAGQSKNIYAGTSQYNANEYAHSGQQQNQQSNLQTGVLKLIAVNAPQRVEVVLDKAKTSIGKRADWVDFVVSFNNMISRKHCTFYINGNTYYIVDEKSANGTYVNGYKLQPSQYYQVKRGDIIRMADSDFQLV